MKTPLLFSALISAALALPALADGMHAHAQHQPAQTAQAAARVDRVIAIDMSDDMRFSPSQFTATQGETIRFVVRNAGRLKHEMVIGSIDELKAHAEMMRKMPGMAHAEPNQVGVQAGRTGEMVWQFSRAGTYDFACLEPGHSEAGMKGRIAVKARS